MSNPNEPEADGERAGGRIMSNPNEPETDGERAGGRIMSNPNEPETIAQALYHAAVSELSAAHNPALQHDVLKQLEELIRGGDQSTALITSAVELTADEKRALESKLSAKFGRQLIFEYKVDPALLGGVVAKVGDKIIDGSLAGKLNALQESLVGSR
jgi:F-type H+-transporting ATPase subunit delta